eukprot:CAMPEP_0113476754 /NCGR_PEP_ID=MMETSP0014_2-20120614/19838_1 /TAXON_ID=2857 /ORGANISM="Nitzschia sp." /LENGTH=184 /DNA_ID=CAMNT_0000369793 /DNA_START=425 /DNA_END=979 /DNA_ORIENTATION=- /assembly_acc=CAM_ASM_000159
MNRGDRHAKANDAERFNAFDDTDDAFALASRSRFISRIGRAASFNSSRVGNLSSLFAFVTRSTSSFLDVDARFDPPDDVCLDPTDIDRFDPLDNVRFGVPDGNSNRRFADEPSPKLDFDFAPFSARDFVFLFAVSASVDPDIYSLSIENASSFSSLSSSSGPSRPSVQVSSHHLPVNLPRYHYC